MSNRGRTFSIDIIDTKTGITVLTCGRFNERETVNAAVERVNRALSKDKPRYTASVAVVWADTSNKSILVML